MRSNPTLLGESFHTIEATKPVVVGTLSQSKFKRDYTDRLDRKIQFTSSDKSY